MLDSKNINNTKTTIFFVKKLTVIIIIHDFIDYFNCIDLCV